MSLARHARTCGRNLAAQSGLICWFQPDRPERPERAEGAAAARGLLGASERAVLRCLGSLVGSRLILNRATIEN